MSVNSVSLVGPMSTLRANDLHDNHQGVVIQIENRQGQSLTATLDRGMQHMLFLWLRDRLGE